ncbi:hypothetical protein ACJJIE_06465 [Microbulbifer sp. TRSA001]|uniref:hypothetical protein n=1 Tax=Microbulbifer sp. TRSA001 TaxID=3243381 RepID=UPI00403A5DAE
MKKELLLVFCVLFFSGGVLGDSEMRLFLENVDSKLRIYVINEGVREIYFNKRFAVGPTGGPNEIVLHILDQEGSPFPFDAKIRLRSAGKKDYVFLAPGDLVGREYPIDNLITYYSLQPGSYSLRAFYGNQHAEPEELSRVKLESNAITLRVED